MRRGVWVMPCTSDGSSLIRFHQLPLGMPPKPATVKALLSAMPADSRGAPSMRAVATGSPEVSVTAMQNRWPIASALASAASSALRAPASVSERPAAVSVSSAMSFSGFE